MKRFLNGKRFSLNYNQLSLIEQGGLVAFDFLKDGAHEGFTDELAAIGDAVALTETVQRPLFALVEEDGYSIFARSLHGK